MEIQRKKKKSGPHAATGGGGRDEDLQTCTSIATFNLIVIQAICPQICDIQHEGDECAAAEFVPQDQCVGRGGVKQGEVMLK